MKFYSPIEQELISVFTKRLHEEFKKQYKGKAHFDLLRDSENENYFICKVTFIKNEFTLYCTQFKVEWVDFLIGIQYDKLARDCCINFRKWIYDKYFF